MGLVQLAKDFSKIVTHGERVNLIWLFMKVHLIFPCLINVVTKVFSIVRHMLDESFHARNSVPVTQQWKF